MREHDESHDSFEDMIRSVMRDVSEKVERVTQIDVDEIAGGLGVDPDRTREWFDTAGRWFRAQVENLGDEATFGGEPPAEPAGDADPLRRAAAHPLDLPTEEQGVALAALESERWTVEPGSNKLAAHGDGPGPSDALGLVRELRAHDWIATDGKLTLVGRHALSQWLDAAGPR